MRSRPAGLAALMLFLACAHAHQLAPAPGASVEPGHARIAEQTVEGVRLRVDSSAWREGPVRDVLSPVEVEFENGSDHALRVAYSQLTLSDGRGFRLQALPPFQVALENATAAVVPDVAWSRFWLSPWDARFYHPGLPVWSGAWAYDPAYYASGRGGWPAALPDQDVLRRALPEGVLEPGGAVSGFLYFPDQPAGKALTFTATLVDANTNEVFGAIEIPFVVK